MLMGVSSKQEGNSTQRDIKRTICYLQLHAICRLSMPRGANQKYAYEPSLSQKSNLLPSRSYCISWRASFVHVRYTKLAQSPTRTRPWVTYADPFANPQAH